MFRRGSRLLATRFRMEGVVEALEDPDTEGDVNQECDKSCDKLQGLQPCRKVISNEEYITEYNKANTLLHIRYSPSKLKNLVLTPF